MDRFMSRKLKTLKNWFNFDLGKGIDNAMYKYELRYNDSQIQFVQHGVAEQYRNKLDFFFVYKDTNYICLQQKF